MKLVDLLELIECLEYGTRIHISVVFLNDFGNNKTQLPFEKVIHSKPYCTYMKSFEGGYNKCYACRNAALKKAIKHKTPFGGKCINGVYEYVHPVVIGGNAVAVVFAGNILTDDINVLRETLETVIDIDRLEKFCEIIDAHIKLLDREYSNIESGFDARMTNLVNFIQDSLCDDLSVSRIASIFGYSEKYIGQIFKRSMGLTVKEYVNSKRLDNAERLLRITDFSVTEISLRSGFNNVTYFNRLFKNRHNKSPREYRNALKNSAHT